MRSNEGRKQVVRIYEILWDDEKDKGYDTAFVAHDSSDGHIYNLYIYTHIYIYIHTV